MKQLDLNLLKVLRTLLEVKNTRKTGEILCLSQPAVSRALSRLRDHFDDELFIRSSHGLEPTAKAEEIGARLPAAMDLLMEVIEGGKDFDPSLYHGKVILAINGFIAHWLAPPLIRRIVQEAPNIEIHITNWDATTPEMICEGQVQLGVNYFPLALSKQLVQKKMGSEEFVVLCRNDHPLNVPLIKPEHFEHYPIASQLIPNWNDVKEHVGVALKPFGIPPKIQLRSSHLNIILNALDYTDMLLPCSKLLALTVADKYRAMPIDKKLLQPNGDFALVLANKSRRHPLNVWLRICVEDCVQEAIRAHQQEVERQT